MKNTPKKELTAEEIEAKTLELESKQKDGRGVFAFVFQHEEYGQLIGFIVDPKRIVKDSALNLLFREDMVGAGKMILENCLLKNESDKIIVDSLDDDSGKLDDIYYGSVGFAVGRLKVLNGYQKKS